MAGIVYLKTIIVELIALQNNNQKLTLLEQIKKDLKSFSVTILVLIVIFIIVFYKENIFTTIWVVLSFVLTFVLPGFTICYLWYNKLDFIERLIIGTMLGLISIGILSYNISVYLGIDIKIISIITPIIVTLIYGGIVYFVERNQHKEKIKIEEKQDQKLEKETN